MVEQGGVKVNADKISDVNAIIEINDTVLQKGKKNIIKVQNYKKNKINYTHIDFVDIICYNF